MIKLCIIVSVVGLYGCSMFTPDLYKTVDDIATDGVIQIQIDKQAFNTKTNTNINIQLNNREFKQ